MAYLPNDHRDDRGDDQNQRTIPLVRVSLSGRREVNESTRLRGGGASHKGRRLKGFLGLSLDDRTILFLAILLDKTVSVR